MPEAIAASRIYLQAHWPSDVGAGLAFAVGVTAAFVLALSWLPVGEVAPRGLGLTVGAALLVAGSANIAMNFDRARESYAPHEMLLPIGLAEWQADGAQIVGRGRVGFEGEVETPFFLQWLGDRTALDAALVADGWSRSPAWNLETLGLLLQPGTGVRDVPVLPQLHLGRAADERWIKPLAGHGRLVFRLWLSRYTVDELPLYVGTIEAEDLESIVGLFTVFEERPLDDADLAPLRQAIDAASRGSEARHVFGDPSAQLEEDDDD